MNSATMILASASPRRAELLKQLDVPFDILPSRATELMHEQLSAGELCQINAYRKARTVAKKHPDAVVIGVDTLVALGPTIFGKPATRQEAIKMLQKLQGKTHHVSTGVCLVHLREHRQQLFSEITEVTFRSLTKQDIESYLDHVDPLDKAGGYGIQEHGDDIVRTISGSFSNVVGLPLERLREAFADWGLAAALSR